MRDLFLPMDFLWKIHWMLTWLEEERRSGRSYFSFLPKDLTAIYLTRFLGYWIDSSRWLNGTFNLSQMIIPGIQQNTTNPIIQGNELYCFRTNDSVSSHPGVCCLTTGHLQTFQRDATKFDCFSTFLPNLSVVSGGCSHNPNVVLTSPTKQGWVKKTLLIGPEYSAIAFDEQGQIYVYHENSGYVYCFTTEGRLRWQEEYSRHLPINHFVVVDGLIFFLDGRLHQLTLSTKELVVCDFPQLDTKRNSTCDLHTDHHQHLVIIDDSALFILDLKGVFLRQISFLSSPFQNRSLVLHPNGDFYFLSRQSDGVTIVSSRRRN